MSATFVQLYGLDIIVIVFKWSMSNIKLGNAQCFELYLQFFLVPSTFVQIMFEWSFSLIKTSFGYLKGAPFDLSMSGCFV